VVRRLALGTGIVTTIAGEYQSSGSTDGIGTAARFSWPTGITINGRNLFVCDNVNDTIRQLNLDTMEVSTLAGTAGSSGSDDGDGPAARFHGPTDITTDGTNLYVTDGQNHTIRKIVISTTEVTTLAGAAGSSGTADGTGSAARFFYPKGITTDGTYLYVADSGNHAIRQIDPETAEVTTFAGQKGVSGYSNETGTAAQFNVPWGTACDGSSLYVTENGNEIVRKIDLDTAAVSLVAGSPSNSGWADGTGMDARFDRPRGIACDGRGLWVMDNRNYVLRRVE
jgi:hypothetical protein